MEGIVEQRAQRWREFMDMRSSRNRMFLVSELDDPNPHVMKRVYPNLWPENWKARAEQSVREYEYMLEKALWLDDDSIPHANLLTGTEIFAECFGCRIHRPGNDMPFALPFIKSAQEADKLPEIDLWQSPLTRQFDIADHVQKLHPKAMMSMPDIQSPIDIAALIWEKTDFYVALIESPEVVHRLCGKILRLQFAFFDEWFRRYGTRFVAHFPEYYMEGGLTISEDEIGVINPEMFLEYCLDDLNALSDRYGGLGVHCCADAVHQWDNLKKIRNLRLLNLGQPRDVFIRAAEEFADLVPQWHGFGVEDLELIPKRAHMVVSVQIKGMEHTQIIETLMRAREHV